MSENPIENELLMKLAIAALVLAEYQLSIGKPDSAHATLRGVLKDVPPSEIAAAR